MEKGRLEGPVDLRLEVAATSASWPGPRCVIEAVAEDLAVKQALFADLEKVVAPDCVLATNTSSLSPTAIAAGLSHPGRLVGLHFFNPAPVMRLVEVVSGLATDPAVAAAVTRLAEDWGKQVVQASATPGFIVNRVARPFYAEALRLAEERAASPATIDAVLTRAGGFRMGPFALMDLVGQDVNEAVTRSVWTAFGYDPRFAPSLLQRALVEAGWLGRKTGRGWYRTARTRRRWFPRRRPHARPPAYVIEHGSSPLRGLLGRAGVEIRAGQGPDGTVELPGGAWLVRCDGRTATALAAHWGRPAVVVDRTLDDAAAAGIAIAASDGGPESALAEATGLLQAAGLTVYVVDDAPGLVVTRTVAMLVNGAVDARHKGWPAPPTSTPPCGSAPTTRWARWPGDRCLSASQRGEFSLVQVSVMHVLSCQRPAGGGDPPQQGGRAVAVLAVPGLHRVEYAHDRGRAPAIPPGQRAQRVVGAEPHGGVDVGGAGHALVPGVDGPVHQHGDGPGHDQARGVVDHVHGQPGRLQQPGGLGHGAPPGSHPTPRWRCPAAAASSRVRSTTTAGRPQWAASAVAGLPSQRTSHAPPGSSTVPSGPCPARISTPARPSRPRNGDSPCSMT